MIAFEYHPPATRIAAILDPTEFQYDPQLDVRLSANLRVDANQAIWIYASSKSELVANFAGSVTIVTAPQSGVSLMVRETSVTDKPAQAAKFAGKSALQTGAALLKTATGGVRTALGADAADQAGRKTWGGPDISLPRRALTFGREVKNFYLGESASVSDNSIGNNVARIWRGVGKNTADVSPVIVQVAATANAFAAAAQGGAAVLSNSTPSLAVLVTQLQERFGF